MIRSWLTNEQRNKIVSEATSWIGTRYHHAADVKGHGVDCAMILVRVYTDLGLAPKFDPRPYPAQWYLHRDEERYVAWIEKYCIKIDKDQTQPGDILLFRFGRCAAHGAIVVDHNLMIHAYQMDGRVQITERRTFDSRLDSCWAPMYIEGDVK